MTYTEQLIASFEKFNSFVSLGLDPIIEEIPLNSGSIKKNIYNFYEEILNCIIKSNVYPSIVKPNYAFYAQYGFEGLEALYSIIELYKAEGFPVLLDVKRGDISKTALAYAKECFSFFKADAVTLAPYMGYDSISPFIDNYPDKGYYILNKTSNKSSKDFQDILVNGKPLFAHTSKKIIDWYAPGIGAVVGATFPEQLSIITDIFIESGKTIPLLIPGVGSQKGDLKEVIKILKRFPEKRIHRINSSSAINYAYKTSSTSNFGEAAVKALENLNNKIESFYN